MDTDKPFFFPYTSQSNLDHVLVLAYKGQLPNMLTPARLAQLAIPEGSAHRTYHAMQFLGRIDSEGHPTEQFIRLAHASRDAYPHELARNVKESYSAIFASIGDPSQATAEQLEAAFAHAYPPKQHRRMLALFRSLCQQANLMPNDQSITWKQKRILTLVDKLIKELPRSQRWMQAERKRWLRAVMATVDLVIEVEEGNMGP